MDENIPNLSNTKSTTGGGNKSSSALAAVPKKPEDLVEENINSQILSILGLEDVFDLTYEEYASLLKEKAVQGRMPGSKMTTESIELITNELKRVRGKTGRFKVTKKKININKVFDRKQSVKSSAIVKSQGLGPLATVQDQGSNETTAIALSQNAQLSSGLNSILASLVSIKNILENQNKFEKKSTSEDKKFIEKQKRKEKEKKLEDKSLSKTKEESKLKAPVIGFFDSIKRFVTNILLGSVVLGLFKWLKNPTNKKAVDDFSKFLTDNAPLILGGLLAIAALPVALTLLKLTGAVMGGVKVLTGAIGALSGLILKIPGVGAAAAAAAPIATAIVASGAAAVGVTLAMKGTYDLVRGQLAGGGDFAKADEQLRSKLAGYGITETGQAMIKGSRQFGKLSASQEKIYKEIQGKRSDLQKLKEERDAKIREIELDEKYYTQKSPRSARVLSSEGARKIQEIRQSYNQKALKLFGTETPTVQPKTPAVSDYKSPFAGARDREALKASKITGNAPISIGERAGFSKSRGRVHAGRDIAAPSGTGLQVPSDSVITDKGFDSGYGNYVVFKDSNGIEHLYGHMLEASPYNEGDRVSAGTVIGRVGSTGRSTGPHLHWEVSRVMGEVGRPRSNVIDPLELGFPAQAPFTGKVDAAKIAPSTPSVPSIPSPTGGNIAMLPLPLGLGKQEQTTSNSGPLQTPVPYFSSEDPNNMTTLVVKAIYNVVG